MNKLINSQNEINVTNIQNSGHVENNFIIETLMNKSLLELKYWYLIYYYKIKKVTLLLTTKYNYYFYLNIFRIM